MTTTADDDGDDESTTDVVWSPTSAHILELNVGGTSFSTSSTTIARFPESMLYALVFGALPTARDGKRRYFVDRCAPAARRRVANPVRSTPAS